MQTRHNNSAIALQADTMTTTTTTTTTTARQPAPARLTLVSDDRQNRPTARQALSLKEAVRAAMLRTG